MWSCVGEWSVDGRGKGRGALESYGRPPAGAPDKQPLHRIYPVIFLSWRGSARQQYWCGGGGGGWSTAGGDGCDGGGGGGAGGTFSNDATDAERTNVIMIVRSGVVTDALLV